MATPPTVSPLEWEAAREASKRPEAPVKKEPEKPKAAPSPAKKKLSWKEERELEGMEAAIHTAEAKVESLQARTTDPAVMSDHVKLHEAFDELSRAHQEVERLYARWAELDGKK